MQRAIVTGADGFLGRHLVRSLRLRGVQVITLTRRSNAEATNVAMGDLPWNIGVLAKVIETAEPDVFFHLVGGARGNRDELEQANLGSAQSVMQALRAAQVRPLVICCGSAAEYGAAVVDGKPICETSPCAPVTAYGAVKHELTNAALHFSETTGTPVLVARIFNPIGPGIPAYLALGSFAQQLASSAGSNANLQTGNLHVFRDFIDVDHVIRAFWLLAENPAARGIVNVCSGQAIELGTLVRMLVRASGKSVALQTVAGRLRRWEPRIVVGSTVRLASLGATPPTTEYEELVGRIWQEAEARRTAMP